MELRCFFDLDGERIEDQLVYNDC